MKKAIAFKSVKKNYGQLKAVNGITLSIEEGEFFGLLGYFRYINALLIGLFRPIYRQVRNSDMRIVAHKSSALAAQNFMLSMTSKGYDTCPMEGFDSLRVKKTLSLACSSEINMIISCGVKDEQGVYGEQIRVPFDEVYFKK